jgi:hypothetical protein
MTEEPEKSQRPWGGFDYLIIVILVFLACYYLAWPAGKMVRHVFQRLVVAFAEKR